MISYRSNGRPLNAAAKNTRTTGAAQTYDAAVASKQGVSTRPKDGRRRKLKGERRDGSLNLRVSKTYQDRFVAICDQLGVRFVDGFEILIDDFRMPPPGERPGRRSG